MGCGKSTFLNLVAGLHRPTAAALRLRVRWCEGWQKGRVRLSELLLAALVDGDRQRPVRRRRSVSCLVSREAVAQPRSSTSSSWDSAMRSTADPLNSRAACDSASPSRARSPRSRDPLPRRTVRCARCPDARQPAAGSRPMLRGRSDRDDHHDHEQRRRSAPAVGPNRADDGWSSCDDGPP